MISIIYVYYNSYDVIVDSINSIVNSNTPLDYEIIIVINKCTDIDIITLQNLSEKIIIIKNEKNLGFGHANNIGSKQASGKYLLILNPDTILNYDVLDKMHEVMEANKDIGASICKLVDENGNLQKTTMRLRYNITAILINLFFLHQIPVINKLYSSYYFNETDYQKTQYPDVISGAFMFVQKSIYDEVNGFDENYFMYSEDNDLSLRIRKLSKLFYFPDVTTVHIGATNFGKAKTKKNISLFYSSMFYYIQKFYGKKLLFVMKLLFKLNAIVIFPFVFFIRTFNLRIYLINRCKVFLQMPFRGQDA